MSTSARKPKAKPTVNKARPANRSYVPTTALASAVEFDDVMMRVTLTDGRILSVPIIWFPTLWKAKPEQRAGCTIGGGGNSLHWPKLNEDLSIAGLMAGVDWRSA